MPHYNHGEFVERALGDVLSQTRGPDSVVVLDDASTDGSADTLERVAAGNPLVQMVRNETNLGAAAAIDRLLGMATTDFVFFAAADDRIHPELFERSLRLLEAHPRAGLCSSLCWIIDEEDRVRDQLRSGIVSDRPVYLPPERVADELLRRGTTWMVSAGLVWRRHALIEAGGFIPALGPFTDSIASMVVALRHGACFIPDHLSSWRRMTGGYSATVAADPQALRQTIEIGVRTMKTRFKDDFPPQFPDRWAQHQQLQNDLVIAHRQYTHRREHWRAIAPRRPFGPVAAWVGVSGSRLKFVADVASIRRSHGLRARDGVVEMFRSRRDP